MTIVLGGLIWYFKERLQGTNKSLDKFEDNLGKVSTKVDENLSTMATMTQKSTTMLEQSNTLLANQQMQGAEVQGHINNSNELSQLTYKYTRAQGEFTHELLECLKTNDVSKWPDGSYKEMYLLVKKYGLTLYGEGETPGLVTSVEYNLKSVQQLLKQIGSGNIPVQSETTIENSDGWRRFISMINSSLSAFRRQVGQGGSREDTAKLQYQQEHKLMVGQLKRLEEACYNKQNSYNNSPISRRWFSY